MNILVTGKCGQVALSLQEASKLHSGVTVTLVGRPELDLAQPETLAPVLDTHRPDLVVSAAAYTAVDQAEDEPDLAHTINAEGPATIAGWCAQNNVQLIHLSTDYVFDGALDRPYKETDQTGPRSVYGRSKLSGEKLVLAAHPQALIVRTAWVYSAYGSNFVKTMLRLAETRDEISVVADQIGNPTSAHDIAHGLLTIASRLVENGGEAPSGIFHLTGSGETNWAAFAREIFAASAATGGPSAQVNDISSADYPTKARRPKNSRLGNDRLEAEFGWWAPDWRESTRTCVARLLGVAHT